MNPEIQRYLEHMQKLAPPREVNLLDANTVHTYQSYYMSRILVLVAEDAKNQAERFEKQIVDLVGIAAEQKRLATKLDVQTDTIISLTRWLRGLTIALVVLAIPLFLEALHFIKPSENPVQAAPSIQQPKTNAQQHTNP